MAIFDLPLTLMPESVHTSSVVLADLENVGVAFAISLLSCVEAEILRYFISTSSNGGYLWFTTYADVEDVHTSPAVLLDPENVGGVIGI